jgi:hypothetical protein
MAKSDATPLPTAAELGACKDAWRSIAAPKILRPLQQTDEVLDLCMNR